MFSALSVAAVASCVAGVAVALKHSTICKKAIPHLRSPLTAPQVIRQTEDSCTASTILTGVFAFIAWTCCMLCAALVSKWFTVGGFIVLIAIAVIWALSAGRVDEAQAERRRLLHK